MTDTRSQLPDWLNTILPEVRPVAVIDTKNDKFTVTVEGKSIIFNTITDAYNYASGNPGGEVFTDRVKEKMINDLGAEDMFNDGDMMTLPVDNGMYQCMMTSTDSSHLGLLAEDIRVFRDETAPEYRKNRNDLKKAWDFIDTHPVFWVWNKDRNPFLWETSGHCDRLAIFPMMTEDGLKIVIESGEHVLVDDESGHFPAGTMHYYNPDLDVIEDTWEEAICAFAAQVDTIFDDNGDPRDTISPE